MLGISQRSGTNYLARVLQCHRECGAPAMPVAEDHLLGPGHLLVEYARAVSRRWHPDWGDPQPARSDLEAALGRGLVSFLETRTPQPVVVSKTPTVEHLDLYPRLFADARLVLLVRDGRAVAESLVKGFGFSYERAIRTWRHGARAILDFQRDAPAEVQAVVVRYESLLDDLDAEVRRVLDACGLAVDGFDFASAHDLPVLGSSFERGGSRKVTWTPIERSDDFDPSQRYESWGRARHARFAWLAGREQSALGYELDRPGRRSAIALVYNVALDAAWPARRLGSAVRERVWLRAVRVRRSMKRRSTRVAA